MSIHGTETKRTRNRYLTVPGITSLNNGPDAFKRIRMFGAGNRFQNFCLKEFVRTEGYYNLFGPGRPYRSDMCNIAVSVKM